MIVISLSSKTALSDTRIAVIYPQTTGGFKQVFDRMIEGIQKTKDIDVILKEVSKSTNPADINNWVSDNNIQSIISLGSAGYEATKNIPENIPTTVGALVQMPGEHRGISLAGDPKLFFKNLRDLAPGVKRVSIVYSEKNTGWLIKIANKAAKEMNIELVAYRAENLKQGLQYYDQLLKVVKKEKDAVWLPLDSIVPDKAILPKLLKLAWDKNFVVFSNKPLHARKGVLFALYPDHKAMGHNLGVMARDAITSKSEPEIIPARSLKIAVNKRTASHLGLRIFKGKKRSYDVVFPSR